MIAARIMIVEDERVVAQNLRRQLARLGYQIAGTATSGEQALRAIDAQRPDVVLMDVHIEGDIDGIETVARIPPELGITVIYLTADFGEPTLERALATRPYGYLLKPLSGRELHASIQMALQRRRYEQAWLENEQPVERLVAKRTAALLQANEELQRESAERLRSERLLHQRQKMEALGRLTGGIAHDFNNALTVIIGNIEIIERAGELPVPRLRRALAAAARGAERAAKLTSHLLAFACRQPLRPRPLDVNQLVTQMSDMFARTLGEDVAVTTTLDSNAWWISADEGQLGTALLNLALNARDAMPNGGRLTITTSNLEHTGGTADPIDDLVAGHYTVLTISDTGCGMAPEVLAHAFEPFFTTKELGEASGLGLSQVYGFARQSGGHVTVRSDLGKGTTVRLYLPRVVAPWVAPAKPSRMGPDSGKGETVLLVEDDDDVRIYSSSMLRELGYRVLEAPDGPTGLRILDSEPGVQLLFTDIGLPNGMNGRQLADELSRHRPDLPVLFTSGYARDAIVHDGRLAPDVAVLLKPYTFDELSAKLREVLESRARQRQMTA